MIKGVVIGAVVVGFFILVGSKIIPRKKLRQTWESVKGLFGFSLMTEEEENFVRLIKLIIGIAPRAVREKFDTYFPPHDLAEILKQEEQTIKDLKCKKHLLSDKQMSLLYPSKGLSSSAKYDITLMICLLRNLKKIAPPFAGFDKLPKKTEVNDGADLARVKFYRNFIAHADKDTIFTSDFNNIWNDLTQAVIRLGGPEYESCCDKLIKMKMTNDIIIHVHQEISEFRSEIQSHLEELRTNIGTLEGKHDTLSKRYDDLYNEMKAALRTQTATIQHQMEECSCQAMHQLELDKWKQQDKNFVEIKAVKYIDTCIQKHHTMTVIGIPGIGKSATVHHAALVLRTQPQNYEIVPCTGPTDIKSHFKRTRYQVFVVDDVCGRYTVNENDIEEWIKYEDAIKKIVKNGKTIILATCRLQIFNENQFQRISLLQNTCDLSSEKYQLSHEEKRQIARKYLPSDLVDDIDVELCKCEYVPLLCSLYDKSKCVNAMEFFNNPFTVYRKELDKLYEQKDKIKLCALFLCVVYNDHIDVSTITEEQSRAKLEQVLEECGVNRGTPSKILVEQLDSLLNTYLEKAELSYTDIYINKYIIYFTVHDKLFDFICFYFGNKMQRGFIKCADRKVIRDRTQFKSLNESCEEFAIIIEEENEGYYFKRVIEESFNSNIRDMIYNRQMKFTKYRSKLIRYLQHYDNIKTLLTKTEDDSGKSLIYMSCVEGYVDLFRFIISVTDDVNFPKCNTFLPLHGACLNGQLEVVTLLIEKGVSVNRGDRDGETPLLMACRPGHEGIVKILIDNAADVNKCNKYRMSPLCWCSLQGFDDISSILIAAGADVNQGNEDGQFPLLNACRKSHYDLVKLILDKGANVNQDDQTGMTPLMTACQGGHKQIVSMLLRRNVDIMKKDNKGWTALTHAIGSNSIVETLLNGNVIPEYNLESSSCDVQTIQKNIFSMSELVNMEDSIGRTPLFWACQDLEPLSVQLLLDKGAIMNRACKKGGTSDEC